MLVINGEKVPTISDAAKSLNIDVNTVRRWIRDDVLPAPPTVSRGRQTVATFPSDYIAKARATLSTRKSPRRRPRDDGKSQPETRVFISYSRKDKKWLEELRGELRGIVRDEQIDIWDDSRIQPGEKWRQTIEKAIKEAHAAILLVSRRFLSSDFIVNKELLPVLRAAKRRSLRVWWIAVSAGDFDTPGISDFQALNDPSHPLNSLSTAKRDVAWVEIGRKIRIALSQKTT